jgi:hypothetical protein
LRLATQKHQSENQGVLRSDNTSGARGVSWSYARQSYQVYATHLGVHYSGGWFKTFPAAEAAAIALRNSLFTHNDLDRQG